MFDVSFKAKDDAENNNNTTENLKKKKFSSQNTKFLANEFAQPTEKNFDNTKSDFAKNQKINTAKQEFGSDNIKRREKINETENDTAMTVSDSLMSEPLPADINDKPKSTETEFVFKLTKNHIDNDKKIETPHPVAEIRKRHYVLNYKNNRHTYNITNAQALRFNSNEAAEKIVRLQKIDYAYKKLYNHNQLVKQRENNQQIFSYKNNENREAESMLRGAQKAAAAAQNYYDAVTKDDDLGNTAENIVKTTADTVKKEAEENFFRYIRNESRRNAERAAQSKYFRKELPEVSKHTPAVEKTKAAENAKKSYQVQKYKEAEAFAQKKAVYAAANKSATAAASGGAVGAAGSAASTGAAAAGTAGGSAAAAGGGAVVVGASGGFIVLIVLIIIVILIVLGVVMYPFTYFFRETKDADDNVVTELEEGEPKDVIAHYYDIMDGIVNDTNAEITAMFGDANKAQMQDNMKYDMSAYGDDYSKYLTNKSDYDNLGFYVDASGTIHTEQPEQPDKSNYEKPKRSQQKFEGYYWKSDTDGQSVPKGELYDETLCTIAANNVKLMSGTDSDVVYLTDEEVSSFYNSLPFWWMETETVTRTCEGCETETIHSKRPSDPNDPDSPLVDYTYDEDYCPGHVKIMVALYFDFDNQKVWDNLGFDEKDEKIYKEIKKQYDKDK